MHIGNRGWKESIYGFDFEHMDVCSLYHSFLCVQSHRVYVWSDLSELSECVLLGLHNNIQKMYHVDDVMYRTYDLDLSFCVDRDWIFASGRSGASWCK